MNGFVKTAPSELPVNSIAAFNEGWALLTAGTPEDYNTMTISWGQTGCLWNLPVCTVFVRPCRHTYGYMEKSQRYTVSLFDKAECREQLKLLGSKSGRDMDKMHESGLTPVQVTEDGLTAYAEAKIVLVVEKLYDHQFDAAKVPQSVKDRSYASVANDDLHRLYIGEIKEAYLRK